MFIDYLEKKGYLECISFNDSLAVNRITEYFNDRSLPVKKELVSLYNWRNGTKMSKNHPSDEYWITLFGIFLSLEDACLHYDQTINEIFKKRKYFPVLSDNIGEYYLYDMEADEKSPKIFFYSPSMLVMKPTPVFFSIKKMFESILECFKKGVFSYDFDCTFISDINGAKEIFKTFNPKYRYWKENDFVSLEEKE